MLEAARRSQVVLGDTRVTYLPDGEVHLEPTALFPASAPDGWAAYAPYLDTDGRLPISVGSFLVQTPDVTALIDLGLGEVDFEVPDLATFRGGALLDNLADEGLHPHDIDLIVYTHLHHDHVGWTTDVAPAPNASSDRRSSGLTFRNARHLVQRREWDHWRGTSELTGPDLTAVQQPLAPSIEFLVPDSQIAPGIQAIATPGHTPGHTSLLISDPAADHRLLVLGDVMHTQAQVSETRWSFLFDVDPVEGVETRVALLDRFVDGRTIIAGGHFAGDVFGRFLPATPRHGWASGAPAVTAEVRTR